jgi:putative transposase
LLARDRGAKSEASTPYRVMPRSARIELEGGVHHVTVRGNRKQDTFRDDRDRSFFMKELGVTLQRYGWVLLAYCLMTNHCHLVIETPKPTLGLGMRRLAGCYAQAFNRRHAEAGHLFQGRYWSGLIDTDAYLGQALLYVAFNPVKVGLCSNPADWPWSSHRWMLDHRSPTTVVRDRVETLLESWGGTFGSRYARLFDPDEALARRLAAPSPWTPRPPLDDLLAGMPRDEGLLDARRHGYKMGEIAAALGVHESTVSRWVRRLGDAAA